MPHVARACTYSMLENIYSWIKVLNYIIGTNFYDLRINFAGHDSHTSNTLDKLVNIIKKRVSRECILISATHPFSF